MIIGRFTRDNDADTWHGDILTLTMQLFAKFQPTGKTGKSEPDYRIIIQQPHCDPMELGAAWRRTSEKGVSYLSVQLEDPAFAAPVSAALFPSEDGEIATLVWNRPKPKQAKAA